MPTPDVVEKLRQLREALATQPDAPTAASLAKQLDPVLVEPFHAPHYHGLRARLLDAYSDLEIEHPRLAGAIQTVIESLTHAGL